MHLTPTASPPLHPLCSLPASLSGSAPGNPFLPDYNPNQPPYALSPLVLGNPNHSCTLPNEFTLHISVHPNTLSSKERISLSLGALATASSGDRSSPMNYLVPSRPSSLSRRAILQLACLVLPQGQLKLRENLSFTGAGESEGGEWRGGCTPRKIPPILCSFSNLVQQSLLTRGD